MSAPNRPKEPRVRTGRSLRHRVADDHGASLSEVAWKAGIRPTLRAGRRAGEVKSSSPSNLRHRTGAVRAGGANHMWRRRHRRCRRCSATLTCCTVSRSALRNPSPGLCTQADAGCLWEWTASMQRSSFSCSHFSRRRPEPATRSALPLADQPHLRTGGLQCPNMLVWQFGPMEMIDGSLVDGLCLS